MNWIAFLKALITGQIKVKHYFRYVLVGQDGMRLLVIFLVALCGVLLYHSVDSETIDVFDRWDKKVPKRCYTVKWVVSNSILRYVVGYFADNTEEKFSPANLKPFTPTNVFRSYYGKQASAVKFSSSILELIPDQPNAFVREDKGVMRRNLYSYIKSKSQEYARYKSSILIAQILADFSPRANYKCINESVTFSLQESLQVELAR